VLDVDAPLWSHSEATPTVVRKIPMSSIIVGSPVGASPIYRA